eukprot:c22196_g1_i2 orf=298-588(-)
MLLHPGKADRKWHLKSFPITLHTFNELSLARSHSPGLWFHHVAAHRPLHNVHPKQFIDHFFSRSSLFHHSLSPNYTAHSSFKLPSRNLQNSQSQNL